MALNLTLRKVYLYLFAIIGLVLVIIGTVSFISLGLRTYVFTKADYPCYYNYPIAKDPNINTTLTEEEQKKQADEQKKQCEEQRTSDKQRQASTALAQLIVGLPLYFYHWMVIRK